MSSWRARCPSPAALERAFWSKDVKIESHASECPRCSIEWDEMVALAEIAQAMPEPQGSAKRCEEIRTTLLSKKQPAEPERRPFAPFVWQLAAAAAAAAVLWWMWPSDGSQPTPTERHSEVLEHGEARYLVASARPDEVIRLVDGSLTVHIGELRGGERVRVITGDAVIEAEEPASGDSLVSAEKPPANADTTLDVTVEADKLVKVRVIQGIARVRAAHADVVVLSSGEVWYVHELGGEAASDESGQEDVEAAAESGGEISASEAAAAAPLSPASPPAIAASKPPVRDLATRPAPAPPAPAPEAAAPATQLEAAADASAPAPVRTAAEQSFEEGWIAIRAGDFEAAAKSFDRAASIGVDIRLEEDARYWNAVALARAGKSDQAIKAFESFIDIYRDSVRIGEASVALGWMLFEIGDYAHAGRRFRAAADDPSERVKESAVRGIEALEKLGL